MPDKPPTTRQAELLAFIREYQAANGRGPSIRDIAAHMGIRSPNGVHAKIKALERRGLIKRQQGAHGKSAARSYEVRHA